MALSYIQIGRLILGPPNAVVSELLGDPTGSTGGAIVAAPRTPLTMTMDLNTLSYGATTLAQAQLIRRQLRSMLSNTDLKMQMGLYFYYIDDPELNGWIVPQPMSLGSPDNVAWRAVGLWTTSSGNWTVAGRRRNLREAKSLWIKDLRTGLYERDTLGWVVSTDFNAFPATAILCLPNGASAIINNVTDATIPVAAMPTGRDSGVCQQIVGAIGNATNQVVDLACLSYERAEAALNLSDVVAYDRMGSVVANQVLNPSFEYDTVGAAPAAWSPSAFSLNAGATLTATNAQAKVGGQSMQIVTTTGASAEGASCPCPGVTFQSGVTYTASVWLKGNAGGEHMQLLLGATIDDAATTIVTLTTSWQRFSVSWTPTAGRSGTTHGITVRTDPGFGALAVTVFADAAIVMQGSSAPVYVDGDSVGYDWQANFGNSLTIVQPVEFYGPDWPYNWLTAGQPSDCPVLANGLVRVRYEHVAGVPGFCVDVWNGSAYVEQGKMVFWRSSAVTGFIDNWASASLRDYTSDRAVIAVVIGSLSDPSSRERIFITMERGSLGATFEYYPALNANGTASDGFLIWTPTVGDLNDSLMKIDSLGSASLPNWNPGTPAATQNTVSAPGKIVATAGTGSALFGGINYAGAPNFTTSENWLAYLRCIGSISTVGPYQHNLAVVQAASIAPFADSSNYGSGAYTTTTNDVGFLTSIVGSVGYNSVSVSFSPTQADQIMEAENIVYGTGTANTADAAASNGHAATATRTTDANAHVTRPTWPNGFFGQYRVFARIKVSANTGSFYVKTGPGAGPTVTSTSTGYIWIDLGELLANNTTFELHAWIALGGTVSVDRIEAFNTQDRTRTSPIYSGARDAGQSVLVDTRTIGTLVAR